MATVHVLGPLACDRVYRVDRLPGHDEKAFATSYSDIVGGPPFQVAAHLAAWGLPVAVHSAIGDDEAGRTVLAELKRHGIDASNVVVGTERTLVPVVIIDRTGEKAIVIDPLSEASLRRIGERFAPASGDAVVTNLFHADTVAGVLAGAAAAGAATFVDLELPELERAGMGPAFDAVTKAQVVCTNAQLLARLEPHGPAERIAAARALAARIAGGQRIGIVTLGAAGAIVASGTDTMHVAAPAVAATNTTGAGDCFAAAFVKARVNGRTPDDAARCAVAAGSLFVAGKATGWSEVAALAGTLAVERITRAGVP